MSSRHDHFRIIETLKYYDMEMPISYNYKTKLYQIIIVKKSFIVEYWTVFTE